MRVNATNYSLAHDDGAGGDYAPADVVVIGVSRSGKTPTCLYMALQYGIFAANYPLTEEDLDADELPARLAARREADLHRSQLRLQRVDRAVERLALLQQGQDLVLQVGGPGPLVLDVGGHGRQVARGGHLAAVHPAAHRFGALFGLGQVGLQRGLATGDLVPGPAGVGELDVDPLP